MDEIEYERVGQVAVVTLSAPERRNALTASMAADFIAVCDEIDRADDIGAAVVRGAGGHFCSGAHRNVLKTAGQDPAEPRSYRDNSAIYGSFRRFGRLDVPTVAAVRGSVVGAGMNLFLAADVRIVARDARLLAGFLRIGIHPGGGHFSLMTRLAGREAAAAMSIFGEEISGADAPGHGLAWSAVAPEEVDDVAFALAERAAADPALARAAIATFRQHAGPPGIPWDVALQAERPSQMWSLRRRHLREPDNR